MAKAILNARVYLAECDLSGVSNAAAINLKNDIVDCTAFSDTYKDKLAGLSDVIVEVSGFTSAEAVTGNPDHKMFDQLALSNAVCTICPEVGTFGTVAYFFRPTLSEYQPLAGKVSDMATFKLHGEGAAPLVKGKVLAAKSARTTTSSGTKINFGTYVATQKLYGALHVFAASGTSPTIDATIAIADQVNTIMIDTAGTGYAVGDELTIVQSGGSNATALVDAVDGGGGVTAVTLATQGSGYAVATGLSTTVDPAGGSGCKINIVTITDTAVITFAQKTDVGQEWGETYFPGMDGSGEPDDVLMDLVSLVTAINLVATDFNGTQALPELFIYTNFKAMWTIGGTLPSLTFAIMAGIV